MSKETHTPDPIVTTIDLLVKQQAELLRQNLELRQLLDQILETVSRGDRLGR